jgi:dTDP-4-dehydrorhamnose 3,5-epimerase
MNNQKRVIILGGNGQLGLALQKLYPTATAGDTDMLDITDKKAVDAFDWSRYEVIINAAAFTNVDGAESPEGRKLAWNVNAVGPANIASAAAKHNLILVHVSSDYVFDGAGTSPITESDPFCPLSVYGESKAAGDIAVATIEKHYITRATWVIGQGKNFVRTMLGLGQKGINPTVVADQIGRLTFTEDLAKGIQHLIETNAPYGTYNLSSDGEPASWAAIAREIFTDANLGSTVTDTSTAEYFASKPESAPRPLNSIMSLDKIKATGFSPSNWRETLKWYIAQELSSTPKE